MEEYECKRCGKKSGTKGECCGEPMQVCRLTATAEHARPMESEEPCDDSRAG